MDVQKRIASLRSLMSEKQIDVYLIPSADNHQSEYVGEHFKSRAFITGFNGSAGEAVITMDDAGLWTDARYFIQAEKQLAGSGVRLFKMGEPDVPSVEEYLTSVLPYNGTIGFDGRVISMEKWQSLKTAFTAKNIKIESSVDLIDMIWPDRPALSKEPAFVLDEKYAGESTASKLARIRSSMTKYQTNVHILSTLDDICWLTNMRGNDVKYSPLILSYAIVRHDSVDLFIDQSKLSTEAKAALAEKNFTIHPYNDIYKTVEQLNTNDVVLIDPSKINCAIYTSIPAGIKKVEKPNPSILFKAIKNEVEIKNIINAHIKDGVAVTKFMHWMKTTIGKKKITEISAAQKLESFRKEGAGYLWQSFEPICAYKEHAAIVHYSASPETDVELKPSHMFLNDTGGNYYEGSTDITRTFILGEITDEEKLHFTTVARSMINLARARFLYGCKGYNLDILARQPMWEQNIDFKHGTGHGVGYLLNIHEGPAGFRWQINPARSETNTLEPGMVITDEPGIYIEGSHGIRTENELLVRKGEANNFGQFMYFEALTYAPIDLDGIDPDLMNCQEKAYLNDYHQKVYQILSPHLDNELKVWLKEYTKEIK